MEKFCKNGNDTVSFNRHKEEEEEEGRFKASQTEFSRLQPQRFIITTTLSLEDVPVPREMEDQLLTWPKFPWPRTVCNLSLSLGNSHLDS